MIIKKYIFSTLNNLDIKYKKSLLSPRPDDATYFSKLALLEYCGWIEEAMDSIARRAVKGTIKSAPFMDMIRDIIESNHGFLYKKHFRPMLTRVVGIGKMEIIENHLITTNQFTTFVTELEVIKSDRDDAAHTWIYGTTKSYSAPSLIKGRLDKICPILKDIYSLVRAL